MASSSCEALFYAMNKGAAEAMGMRSLAADIGITFDAGAALGLVNRRGAGKTRHIDTQ